MHLSDTEWLAFRDLVSTSFQELYPKATLEFDENSLKVFANAYLELVVYRWSNKVVAYYTFDESISNDASYKFKEESKAERLALMFKVWKLVVIKVARKLADQDLTKARSLFKSYQSRWKEPIPK